MQVVAVDRPESRYLVDEDLADRVLSMVSPRLSSDQYGVRTLYLGEVDGTKLRFREYDLSGVWLFEMKRRDGGRVTKWRWEMGRIDPSTVEAAEDVRYFRAAVESDTLRATKDVCVRSRRKSLPGCVLELKGSVPEEIAAELPGPASEEFSKWSWSTGGSLSVATRASLIGLSEYRTLVAQETTGRGSGRSWPND